MEDVAGGGERVPGREIRLPEAAPDGPRDRPELGREAPHRLDVDGDTGRIVR